MFDLPGPLGTLTNLLMVIVGFGGIIFIHELGHFVAAKWAGIRVLAFSMGMGPIVCSYRKGIGFRRGSTDEQYRAALIENPKTEISSTEYRFSALPLGGYVKMLGQEDINPGATSDAPDSYQNRPVWKRMVVISAGVVMNLILAALLFVFVFMIGLRVPTPVIGYVAEGSPATEAIAIDRDDIPAGLLPEDRILEVDGREMNAFNEVTTEVAMSGRDNPVVLLVDRPGIGTIAFEARARRDNTTGFLDLGIDSAMSATMVRKPDSLSRGTYERFSRRAGFGEYVPGATIQTVNGEPTIRPQALTSAAKASNGSAFDATLDVPGEGQRSVRITPQREVQSGITSVGGERRPIEHVLGLRGLLRVDPAASPSEVAQGLMPGDVFVRIGDVEYPSFSDAMVLVPSLKGQDIEIEVLRTNAEGIAERVTLEVSVSREGRIGFAPASTLSSSSLTAIPARLAPPGESGASESTDPQDVTDSDSEARTLSLQDSSATSLIDRPGTRIASIDGEPVDSIRDIPNVLSRLTDQAFGQRDTPGSFDFQVELVLPLPTQEDGTPPTETRLWTLSQEDVLAIRELGWEMPGGQMFLILFERDMVIDKASGPIAAVGRGIDKSRQTMNQTYLTFLRLFQGSVKIEHLKGPVGIAHIGTQVADQGFIWLLFFLGLVSVNLAVINFLPLPIVDGGQFLMLAYEGIRRKPVPIVFQNVVTLAGLILIGSVFLIVTFHDIKALLGL
ncbi:MAG: site-2 protease family protein [Phycisphaerales bacterium]